MSTATDDEEEAGVTFSFEGELLTATDLESGIAASGKSKAEALSRLSDALELHEGGGTPIEDERKFMEEIGINVDETEAEESLPPFLQ